MSPEAGQYSGDFVQAKFGRFGSQPKDGQNKVLARMEERREELENSGDDPSEFTPEDRIVLNLDG